jgi:ABC-type uncharacterized transport system involved in gliding motility auxiliary subunit
VEAATFLRQGSLFQYSQHDRTRMLATAFNGEAKLTGALQAILRGEQMKVCVVVRKGGLRMSDKGNAIDILADMLGRQNIKIEPLHLPTEEKIPDDARAVIFMGITTDLTEREILMLKEYWEGKRHGVLVMLSCTSDFSTPVIEQFLAGYGVTPQNDRVLRTYGTSDGLQKDFQVDSQTVEGSPITRGLSGTDTLLPLQSRSLKLDPNAEIPRQQGIEIRPLLKAADGFWGETQFQDKSPEADDLDNKPPLYIAASLERGASRDPLVAVDSSRMVVIGNSSMLDPDMLVPQNYDFMNAALNWMLQQEAYIGISPKQKGIFTADISKEKRDRIMLITTFILPLAVLVMGFFVWALRRS